MSVRVLGIDPGQSGAIALYDTAHPALIVVADMPIVGGAVDAVELARLIREWVPDLAVVEAVHSMPKQGVASSFKFGTSYGIALGIVGALHLAHRLVAPTVWKKHFRLSADKEQSRALAIRTWPACGTSFSRKKDADRAEAALLARYGADTALDLARRITIERDDAPEGCAVTVRRVGG